MPTARELLEQADALMRRNRQEAERAVRGPGLAPGPPSLREAPAARIDSGPRSVSPAIVPAAAVVAGAPAMAPVPAPAPAFVPAAPVPPAIVARAADDADIPLLDEAVEGTSPATDADGFPLLTDAVDEIEVAAPPVDEGEASDWLLPPPEDESVLGPSPPSVAIVPPALSDAHASADPRSAIVVDVESALTSPRPLAPEIEDLTRASLAEFDPDVTVRRVAPDLGVPVAPPRPVPPEIEDLAEAGLADLDTDVTWTRPIRPAAVAGPSAAAPQRESPASGTREPVDETPVAEPPVMPSEADWDALAEEIRMQVLQRIDMFTDTGLRERLGERLKPIVDRASADLVATINQHVGELLRAYVAEAIEREIDRWRASH
jgi:hypothetical protein